MRTLLIESSPALADPVAGTLDAAGHEVVRCHTPGEASFPCSGLTDDGCPIEGQQGIEAAVAVRDDDNAEPMLGESGITCAIRTGIPVVVVSPVSAKPFERWAEHCRSAPEVGEALDRAVVAANQRRAEPMREEVLRVLEAEGVVAGEVVVDVTREGDTAHTVIRTEHALSEGAANMVATRAHAVDRKGSWPTSKLGVAVATLP